MKTLRYIIGMTEEDTTEQVKDMSQYMNTDEYWLQRGGNGPCWEEGGELLQMCLEIKDKEQAGRQTDGPI